MTTAELSALKVNVDNLDQLIEDLRNAPDEEAFQEVLNHYGLNITVEDLTRIPAEACELSEDDLDDVSGGCKCKGIGRRLFNNFVNWLFYKVTGTKKEHCEYCM